MNDQEVQWFNTLSQQRKALREAIRKNNFSKLWDVITSPYSDQAHFVYELLQNADDCGASEVEFELTDKRLVFKHNGQKRFSISDPDSDATMRDSKNGVLGHVNAITGVRNSTKNSTKDVVINSNSIGKFGIGFKSVFLYTATPHIYDDDMRFKIEDFIVPSLLDKDFEGRKSGTTVFEFPFDRHDATAPAKPAEDVFNKLKKLILPTFFLRNLKKIIWKYGTFTGCYSKEQEELPLANPTEDPITASRVSLKRTLAKEETIDSFLMFSRQLPESNLSYSVAFGLGDDENIKPVQYAPFCYFPTKVDAHLNFVINAPFLLTSDRAGISEATDANRQQNQEMLDRIAKLLADSIVALRDLSKGQERERRYLSDNLIVKQVIPLAEPKVAGWEHLNLKKFYTEPLEVFTTKRVIPCDDGYCDKQHAYAAEFRHMTESFGDSDLQAFVGDDEARWIFKGVQISEGHTSAGNRDNIIRPYILKIANNESAYTPCEILAATQGDFIELRHGRIDWLEKYYEWVAKLSDTLLEKSKRYSIMLDSDWLATAVVNNRGQQQLFLPVKGDSTFRSIHPELHELEEVQKLERRFGMREPSALDIVSRCIAKAERGTEDERDKCVQALIRRACANDVTMEVKGKIIEGLKNSKVGQFKNMAEGSFFKPASELYWHSERLQAFFGNGSENIFIDLNHYCDLAPEGTLKALLSEVGISDKIHLEVTNVEKGTKGFQELLDKLKKGKYIERGDTAVRCKIPQCPCIERRLSFMHKNVHEGRIVDPEILADAQIKSRQIWEALTDIIVGNSDCQDISAVFQGKYIYKDSDRKKEKIKEFPSFLYSSLLLKPWIWCRDDSFKTVKQISTAQLRDEFISQPDYSRVCGLLGIKPVTREIVLQTIAKLPESDQQAYAMGQVLQKLGITDQDDIRRAIELLKDEKAKREGSTPIGNPTIVSPTSPDLPSNSPPGGGAEGQLQPVEGTGVLERMRATVKKAVDKTRDFKAGQRNRQNDTNATTKPILPAIDSDPMQPKSVDFEKRAEELRKKVEDQIDQLKVESELQEKAVEAEEYSYAWLMARLELEMRACGVDDADQREASVSFAKMEREPDTDNMFMLSATSEAIPQWFEEEVNQRLTIRIPGRQDIETVIESMSVMSFRLRAKVRILPGMENIDYSQVVEAKTVATKPTFLLKALKEGYESLNLADEYNLKVNLPEKMRFIFGPPGTGKTTYLARKELIPLAKSDALPHVLVLTPTNKAADVLTKRIIMECGEDESYKLWLTRFGITLDTTLQGRPVARAKDVNIVEEHAAVVVTTVIRFAYDAFTSMGKERLADFRWDYIVIDEASMIPLMQILYPIYKAKNASFVIAGDPMQIAPVVMSDLSVGQNIYTMVGLEDFANPKTEPRDYEVVCLDEQFRSVPCIGRIFSEFAYSGKLRHHRPIEDEKDLEIVIDGMPTIKPLTLLRYPVSRFESIFKIKLLGMSSYQIYSALFVFEYICKLAEGLRNAGRDGFRIGVISPYRAQADIVGRLVGKVARTMLDGVDVNVGTVHSFQGDECEMIIALLNPPQGMGRREGSFINDTKVLNVAISRARDYLVVAIPDEKTPNVQYLRGPLAIAGLMRQTPGVFGELQTPDLEASVWGDRDYVEKNTFSTGHQNVNVYETPEKRFEVRSEDAALDVHFRADQSQVTPEDGFVSERSRIEAEITAEEQARANFVVPEGFHKPAEGERVPAMKQYYIIGNPNPLECESEAEDIDPSKVLAIED